MTKKRITARVRYAPGLIFIERRIHDESIVISGSLSIESNEADLTAFVADELEKAARAVREQDGIVGHIKASVVTTSTSMVSVTEEKAAVKKSPLCRSRITLAAIMFMIDPETAEDIAREALAGVRARLKYEEERKE